MQRNRRLGYCIIFLYGSTTIHMVWKEERNGPNDTIQGMIGSAKRLHNEQSLSFSYVPIKSYLTRRDHKGGLVTDACSFFCSYISVPGVAILVTILCYLLTLKYLWNIDIFYPTVQQ